MVSCIKNVETWKDLSQDITVIIDLCRTYVGYATVQYLWKNRIQTPCSWTVRPWNCTGAPKGKASNHSYSAASVKLHGSRSSCHLCFETWKRGVSSKSFPTILGHLFFPQVTQPWISRSLPLGLKQFLPPGRFSNALRCSFPAIGPSQPRWKGGPDIDEIIYLCS